MQNNDYILLVQKINTLLIEIDKDIKTVELLQTESNKDELQLNKMILILDNRSLMHIQSIQSIKESIYEIEKTYELSIKKENETDEIIGLLTNKIMEYENNVYLFMEVYTKFKNDINNNTKLHKAFINDELIKIKNDLDNKINMLNDNHMNKINEIKRDVNEIKRNISKMELKFNSYFTSVLNVENKLKSINPINMDDISKAININNNNMLYRVENLVNIEIEKMKNNKYLVLQDY